MPHKEHEDLPSSEDMLRGAREGLYQPESPDRPEPDVVATPPSLVGTPTNGPTEVLSPRDRAVGLQRALVRERALLHENGWGFRVVEDSDTMVRFEAKPPSRRSRWREGRITVGHNGEISVSEVGGPQRVIRLSDGRGPAVRITRWVRKVVRWGADQWRAIGRDERSAPLAFGRALLATPLVLSAILVAPIAIVIALLFGAQLWIFAQAIRAVFLIMFGPAAVQNLDRVYGRIVDRMSI